MSRGCFRSSAGLSTRWHWPEGPQRTRDRQSVGPPAAGRPLLGPRTIAEGPRCVQRGGAFVAGTLSSSGKSPLLLQLEDVKDYDYL